MVWLHILMGTLGLVSGWVAIYTSKGRSLHSAAGQVFVGSMMTMAGTGTVLAALESNSQSIVGGAFTFYLVVTAWLTVKTRWRMQRAVLAGMAMLAVSIAGYAAALAIRASEAGQLSSVTFELLIGAIALASASSDLRQVLSGISTGRARIARHAWRMLTALVLASAAFFLGQADEFPKALQHFGLLSLPVMLAVLTIPYWLYRIRQGRWMVRVPKATKVRPA